MRISAIAIISKNRGLGFENKLLFHVPGELPRFKKITTGHPVIMGRKTFESIGRLLPGRTNIIVTRDINKLRENHPGFLFEEIVPSVEEAIKRAKVSPGSDEIFILGGGQIFKEAMSITDRLYLTIVDAKVPADTFFPEYEKEFTKVIEKEEKTDWDYPYTYLTLEK